MKIGAEAALELPQNLVGEDQFAAETDVHAAWAEDLGAKNAIWYQAQHAAHIADRVNAHIPERSAAHFRFEAHIFGRSVQKKGECTMCQADAA